MLFALPMRTLLLAGLVAGACLPLAADGDARYGVEGAVALPSGDLSTSTNNGFEAGVIGRWAMGGGRGLTGRIDLNYFAEKYSVTTTSLGIAADWTFHLTGSQRGPYVLVGASVLDYSQNLANTTLNSSSLGLDLGLGVDFDDHLGALARWTTHYVDHTTWTVLNLGLTYTF